jgi:hypothetical protein
MKHKENILTLDGVNSFVTMHLCNGADFLEENT